MIMESIRKISFWLKPQNHRCIICEEDRNGVQQPVLRGSRQAAYNKKIILEGHTEQWLVFICNSIVTRQMGDYKQNIFLFPFETYTGLSFLQYCHGAIRNQLQNVSHPAGCNSTSLSVVYDSTKVTLNLSNNAIQAAWRHSYPAVCASDFVFHQRRFWGECNEWTGSCLLLMNPKLMLRSFSVHLNAKERISHHNEINTNTQPPFFILRLCFQN